MFNHTHILALLLLVPPSLPGLWANQKPTEITDSCSTPKCHNSYLHKKYVHKPVTVGVCKFCHKPVDPTKHTFKLVRTRNELCGVCHQENAATLKVASPADQLRPKAQVGKGKYLHRPIQEGKCLDCHNPHGGENKYFLSAAKVAELCRKCHKNTVIVSNSHKPFAEGECNKCHDSHGSNYRYLLINNQRQLCFSCHEDTKTELENFKYIHKPVVDRECIVCHAPHGSNYFRLLIKEYTSQFYAPFESSNYDLCFSCHQADKVLVKETESLTDFRNGKTNLHYMHVNSQEKGRTCRTCHATHASDEPKHLRKAVPYGGWEIPIQFEKTETGGSCSPGCHNARAYDRLTPAIYKSPK